jgi:hypothetical protein
MTTRKSCLVPIDVGTKTKPRRIMRYYAEVPADTVDNYWRVTCDNRLAVNLRNARLYNDVHLQLIQGDRFYPVASGAMVKNLYVTKPDGRKVRFLGGAYRTWFLNAARGQESREGLLPEVFRERKMLRKDLYGTLEAGLQGLCQKVDIEKTLRRWEKLTTNRGTMSQKDYQKLIREGSEGEVLLKAKARKPSPRPPAKVPSDDAPQIQFTEFLLQQESAPSAQLRQPSRSAETGRPVEEPKQKSRAPPSRSVRSTNANEIRGSVRSTNANEIRGSVRSTNANEIRGSASSAERIADSGFGTASKSARIRDSILRIEDVLRKEEPPEMDIFSKKAKAFRPLPAQMTKEESKKYSNVIYQTKPARRNSVAPEFSAAMPRVGSRGSARSRSKTFQETYFQNP